MTSKASENMICEWCAVKPAEKRFTWVNSAGSGIGSSMQGACMCSDCMESMWDSLSRFPNAKETVTLWPLPKGGE